MDKKNNSLRAAAEKQLQHASTIDSTTRSAEELLHELQVHQVELEIQNENLRQSYEAVAESQQDYFELYEFSPVGYLTLSHQGLIEKINLTGATLLGKNHSQLLQRRFAGFINATDTTRWHLFFAQVMRGNEQKTLEVSLKQPNDNLLYVQLHCRPVLKENKQPTLRIVLTDITESKQAAAELVIANKEILLAKDQLQEIINLMPIAIFIKDTQHRIILINKACEKQWGLSFSQVKNTTGSQFFPPEQMTAFLAIDKQAFADGKPHETENLMWNSPLQANRIHHSYKQVVFDESGQPLYLIGVSEDITERKRTEEALIKTQFDLQEAQRVGKIGSWSWDITIDTIKWSDELYKIHNRNPAVPLPTYQENLKFYTPESAVRLNAAVENTLKTGESYQTDLELTQTNQITHWIAAKGEAVKDSNGQIIALRGTVHDISERKRIEKQLTESERHLRAILETTSECVKLVARDGTLLSINAAGLALIEADSEDAVLNQCVYTPLAPEYRDAFQTFNEAVCDGKSGKIEFEMFSLKGTRHWMETHSVPFSLENGDCVQLAFTREITERKRLEKSLHDSELKFRALFDFTSDAIMLYDSMIFDCNQAALTLFGCKTVTEFCTYHPADLSPLEQPCGTNSLILAQQKIATAREKGELRFEWTHKRMDTGNIFVTEVLLSALILNEKTVLQGTVRDITERKAIEEKIQQLAFFDPLTGLPNRRKLHDRLQYAIAINRRNHNQFAVFMMDLDKFKAVNDKLGHAAGDELLKQVAARIIDCLRDSDMVARLGGDEFVFVLENLKIPEMADIIALKVIASLTLPFQLSDNNTVQIGASIGISIYPQHGNTPESLMDHADTALYQAKDNGRSCFAYFSGNGLTLL
ncbi:hypothetical protein BCS42_00690 [Crenothrix sp. D3]|nr:hypothetical protein BCS42_00690 [Crenothrix sp. D3]